MSLTAPFSFQLYSARKYPPLNEQLQFLADLGYTNVEPYRQLFDDIGTLKADLEANGLSALTAHVGLHDLETNLDDVVAKVKDLGVQTVVAPAVPHGEREKDLAGWKAVGRQLEIIAEELSDKDLDFAWHNHAFEFVRLEDGSYPIEHILGDTLGWEVDVAWIACGNADPIEWMERYSGRVVAAHIKDLAPKGECADEDGWADVGQGTMDWPALWNAAVNAGAQIMIAEHDNPNDYKRFARRSIDAMKRLAENS